jgi:hypothetical protein
LFTRTVIFYFWVRGFPALHFLFYALLQKLGKKKKAGHGMATNHASH